MVYSSFRGIANLLRLAKVKAAIVLSVFVLFSPLPLFPPKNCQHFAAAWQLGWIPHPTLQLYMLWSVYLSGLMYPSAVANVMIIIDNDGSKWDRGRERERQRSQVINNSIYRQLSANNEKFNKNIHVCVRERGTRSWPAWQWPQWRIRTVHKLSKYVWFGLVLLLRIGETKRNETQMERKNAAGLPPNAMMSEKLTCM